jgi:hypothetical protein
MISLKTKYICIYYDGNDTFCKVVEFDGEKGEGPYGCTPEKLGMPGDYMITALIELKTPDDLPLVVIDDHDAWTFTATHADSDQLEGDVLNPEPDES